ncbi:hypothetical protein [Spiroplasma taiwanense]|uniref:Uncharacterized protein n=1 Tax=Spiroplasma taiwanense CT-1 TaxID=1276220 RepID=S5MHQ9_9MOLU|nr:hypothetical protein [Spiroplasma taiwanense]AGR41415.1 hypothetical protein STAIW_v1c08270 [Spiroplasma taiwanense CT-1]
MYYTNNNFWIIGGADFCWSILRSMRVKMNLKDLNLILKEIIENNKEIEFRNKKLKMVINAWIEVRRLILISKKHDEVKSRENWNVRVEDLKTLYLILEPNGQFWRTFEFESPDSLNVVKEMEDLKEQIYLIKDLKSFFETISYFYHRNYLEGTFGKATSLFFIFLMQAMLIYKGYGPMIVFPKNFKELEILGNYQNNFYMDIAGLSEIKWKRSEYFYKIIDFWIEKSENYLNFIEKNYIE